MTSRLHSPSLIPKFRSKEAWLEKHYLYHPHLKSQSRFCFLPDDLIYSLLVVETFTNFSVSECFPSNVCACITLLPRRFWIMSETFCFCDNCCVCTRTKKQCFHRRSGFWGLQRLVGSSYSTSVCSGHWLFPHTSWHNDYYNCANYTAKIVHSHSTIKPKQNKINFWSSVHSFILM